MPSAIRGAVLVGPREIELRPFAEPAVAGDAALVSVELCGVCGTDLKYFSGALPAPYPMILGHEVVARVERIGDVAAARYGLSAGDRVIVESSIPCWSCPACRSGAYTLCPTKGGYGTRVSTTVTPGLWGGMAERMYIAPGSILHRIPPEMAAEVALGVPILANALQWLVQRGGLGPGQRLLIQGCGPQGLAAALVARSVGAAEVTVTGLPSDAARLAFAAGLGARTVAIDAEWTADTRKEALGTGYDVALDVSGSRTAIASAPEHVRPRGTFVLAGLVGRGAEVAFRTDDLVYREIRIQGVLSKDEAALRSALALVESDAEVAEALGRLTTHVFPLERAADAISAASDGLDGFVKAAVRPTATAPVS